MRKFLGYALMTGLFGSLFLLEGLAQGWAMMVATMVFFGAIIGIVHLACWLIDG